MEQTQNQTEYVMKSVEELIKINKRVLNILINKAVKSNSEDLTKYNMQINSYRNFISLLLVMKENEIDSTEVEELLKMVIDLLIGFKYVKTFNNIENIVNKIDLLIEQIHFEIDTGLYKDKE